MLEPGTKVSLGEGKDYVVDDGGFVYAEVGVSYEAFRAFDPKAIENSIVWSMVHSEGKLRDAKIRPTGVANGMVVFSVEGDASRMIEHGALPDMAFDAMVELQRRGMDASNRIKTEVAVDLSHLLIMGKDQETFESWLSGGVTGNDELSDMTYEPVRVEGDTIVFGVRGDPRYAMASLGLIEHPEDTAHSSPGMR